MKKCLDMVGVRMIYYSSSLGEVSEWFKEPVLKTGDSERGRGFESHPLRHKISARRSTQVAEEDGLLNR